MKLKLPNSCFILTFILIYIYTISITNGLRCYKCTANEVESDCETEIKNMPPVEVILKCKAHQKFCTIRRTERNSMKGKVHSIARNCEMRPHVQNKVIVDDEYTTYFVACQDDLCNDGDGTTHKVNKQNENAHKPELPPYQALANIRKNGQNRCSTSFYLISFMLIILIYKRYDY